MNNPCQNETLPSGSSPVPRAVIVAGQVQYYLRERGLLLTISRILSRAVAFLGKTEKRAKTKKKTSAAQLEVPFCEVLDLHPGELVEVKSENEIRQTLDGAGRNRGLFFPPEMREYCGKKLRVFKRVERICMENSDEVRRLSNTVILEGAICRNNAKSCDRSCFFFFREAWLRRISGD